MPYTLVYHPDVRSKDIPTINDNLQKRIARAIETRLTTDPERYGEPLRRTLQGYWKLRVGDYRVVFKVVKNEVWIYGIIHRRDVYDRITHRIASEGLMAGHISTLD
jgi:mRNA interferase RelE/StbE